MDYFENVNPSLKEYIESVIFVEYSKNDKGHDVEHIKTVIRRSFEFAEQLDNINWDMVFVVAAFHDVGHHIDAKHHEKVSAQILLQDKKLKDFFSEEQIITMAVAVEDHRASSDEEPRNIYGKIVSSADRTVDLNEPLKRTHQYNLVHCTNLSIDEQIERAYQHLKEKFGVNGYAVEKSYFEDKDYEKFLIDLRELLADESEFKDRFCKINNIQLTNGKLISKDIETIK